MSVVGLRLLVFEELLKYGYYMDKIFIIKLGIIGLW